MGATGNAGDNQEEVASPELAAPQQHELALSKTDLTVCDIIGDWGPYQWSLTLFALIYSALAGCFVVVGPIWTPDINHVCKPLNYNRTMDDIGSIFRENTTDNNQNECFFIQQQRIEREIEPNLLEQTTNFNSEECIEFVYDDEKYGKLLTNTVSIKFVCLSRKKRNFLPSIFICLFIFTGCLILNRQPSLVIIDLTLVCCCFCLMMSIKYDAVENN